MLLEFGTAVRYTREAARGMLPVDRVNREKLMALTGTIHAFLPRDFVEVDFDGRIVKVELNQIEPA